MQDIEQVKKEYNIRNEKYKRDQEAYYKKPFGDDDERKILIPLMFEMQTNFMKIFEKRIKEQELINTLLEAKIKEHKNKNNNNHNNNHK